MDDAQWQQLKDLFFQVIDLSEADRAAFLEQITDHEIRDALMRLIAEDAEAASLLDASPDDLALLIDEEEEAAEPIQQIGPYRIGKTLGRGGMGTVYLAERDDGAFRQQVALKVIRRGLDTDDILRRFRMERQILAALTHPHIARILDGGSTEDGLPYLVMEYIDGVPITTYCDVRRLSVDARLSLFREVCQAVQYAHQNLIVHRDLKPSNILVTEEGTVKLLDFGIAKLLNPNLPGYSSPLTQTAWRVMTPEYASPEQVRGETITTASDVYALGVLLYELLTGRRPYRLPSRLEQEVFRVICEVEPARPSTAVSQVEEVLHRDGQTNTITPEQVSEARSTQVERLRRRLRGDLDNIVLKALQKEPGRRYGSVEQFAEDVRRYGVGLPVMARRETIAYRMSKFVRRHRVGVTMAVLVVLLLAGFAITTAVQQTQTAQALARAEREAAKAERVSTFLMGLFEANDPSEARGEAITALDLLERGVTQAEALSDEPEAQAQLLDVTGQVYWSLGRYVEAVPLLEQGLALRRQVFGPEHEEVALSLDNLARLQSANGNYEVADSLHRQALTMRRKLMGNDHTDVAISLSNLAITKMRQGAYEEAEALHRESLALRRKLLSEDDPQVAVSLSSLAFALRRNGKYEEAEALYRESLALRRRTLGEDHPDVASSISGLSMVLWRQGRYEEAETLQREALVLQRKLLGEEHPTVATGYDNLGLLLKEQGKYAESEAMHRASLALYRTLLGDDHPNVATSLHNLASVLIRQGKYAEAEPIQRESLERYRTSLGEEHPYVAMSLDNLGTLLRDQGRYDEAAGLHEEALALRRTSLGAEHPDVAISLINLGTAFKQQGRYEEAEPFLRESMVLRRKVLGEAHWKTGNAQSLLGECLVQLGRYAEAEPLLLQGHTTVEAALGQTSTYTRGALEHLVALYDAWGKPAQAEIYRAKGRQP